LFAINYEILTEGNLNLNQSGAIPLITFLGGVGFFFGPIIGAVVFTLLQTVLSLETELWQLYVGALFVATVMYFPGGLAGVIMMHAPAFHFGKARLLILPYIKTLIPAVLGIFGTAALIEMIFHYRHAATGEEDMTVFWITFNSHAVLPWVIAAAVTGAGFWLARRNSPELVEAWHLANTPDGGAPA